LIAILLIFLYLIAQVGLAFDIPLILIYWIFLIGIVQTTINIKVIIASKTTLVRL